MSRKQYRLAAREFEAALRAAPSADAHYNLGIALKYQQNFPAALKQFSEALQLKTDFAEAMVAMGETTLIMGGRQQAKAHLEKAIETEPRLVDAYYHLGMVFSLEEDWKRAIETFRKGLNYDSQNARIAFRLAWLLATVPDAGMRNGAEALRLAKLINSKTDGKSPQVLDILAAAHAENGQFEKAAETADNAYNVALRKGNRQLAEKIEARKILYQNGKPYRMEEQDW